MGVDTYIFTPLVPESKVSSRLIPKEGQDWLNVQEIHGVWVRALQKKSEQTFGNLFKLSLMPGIQ